MVVSVNIPMFLVGRILTGIAAGPRWLIYRERYDEALRILTKLRSRGDEPNMEIQMEYTSIVQDVNFDKRICPKTFTTLLKKGTENNRRRTLLGITAHTFTQLTGMAALWFYLPHILESAGFEEIYSALLGNSIGGTVNFLASIPVYFFVDRWDRRLILSIGAICMAMCMFAIAAVLGVYHGSQDPASLDSFKGDILITNIGATYAVLVLLCIFCTFYALSWGPVGWLYPAEIYPQLLRANAMGVTTSSSYLFNVIVTLISPVMFYHIRYGTYLVFGSLCLLMAWVVRMYFPETRGRSLEEINLLFSGALLDQRPGAHHPATAAEALLHLEQIRYRDKRERLARNPPSVGQLEIGGFISGPHSITRSPSDIQEHHFEEQGSETSVPNQEEYELKDAKILAHADDTKSSIKSSDISSSSSISTHSCHNSAVHVASE
ncbi:hypothetical protein DFQ28_002426 [Apophysomyces sp. BC1034]|nr:hypothetical protein DFQ30_000475 [Apophysomyces sp. BC1015]KAG0190146.1 hypothetical protein DFQ28_002426 [Apophysomyces sp. BC1034]